MTWLIMVPLTLVLAGCAARIGTATTPALVVLVVTDRDAFAEQRALGVPLRSRDSPRPRLAAQAAVVSGTGTTTHGSWFQNRARRTYPRLA
jgi:hypothetical protein